MQNFKLIITLFFIFTVFVTTSASAQSTTSLQGQLVSAAGISVDGSFNLAVRLFDQEKGGNELWLENFQNVAIVNGTFNLRLGETEPLQVVVASNAVLWVEIKVDTEPSLSRRPLDATPRALVSNDVVCLGCITPEKTSFLSGCTNGQLLGFDGTNWGCVNPGQGPAGEKGEKGDTGETGPKGDKGDIGKTGKPGPKGDTGDTGDQGDKGDKGDKGDPGILGLKGDTGDKGDKGDPGIQGLKGDPGSPAVAGLGKPDFDSGEVGFSGETITVSVNHNLGVAPTLVHAFLVVRKSGVGAFKKGDRIPIAFNFWQDAGANFNRASTLYYNSTTIKFLGRFDVVMSNSSNESVGVNSSNFNIRFLAWK